jgi:hypothetical protein
MRRGTVPVRRGLIRPDLAGSRLQTCFAMKSRTCG